MHCGRVWSTRCSPCWAAGRWKLLLRWRPRSWPRTWGWRSRSCCPTSSERSWCHHSTGPPSRPGRRRGGTYWTWRLSWTWLAVEMKPRMLASRSGADQRTAMDNVYSFTFLLHITYFYLRLLSRAQFLTLSLCLVLNQLRNRVRKWFWIDSLEEVNQSCCVFWDVSNWAAGLQKHHMLTRRAELTNKL